MEAFEACTVDGTQYYLVADPGYVGRWSPAEHRRPGRFLLFEGVGPGADTIRNSIGCIYY